MTSAIGRMIDNSGLRCTVCNRPKGDPECRCWTKCPGCGWSYRNRTGESCRNPIHEAARRRRSGRPLQLRKKNDG